MRENVFKDVFSSFIGKGREGVGKVRVPLPIKWNSDFAPHAYTIIPCGTHVLTPPQPQI